MITAIEIENFKGFGERQRFELAPITLLFGANSAGKSSLFRALFLLRNMLLDWREKQGLERFQDDYDLGNFRDYVHNHDMTSTVRLKIELNTGVESWIGDSVLIGTGEFSTGERCLQIEIGICNSGANQQPLCSEFCLSADGKRMLEMNRVQDKYRNEFEMTSHLENLQEWVVELDWVESTGFCKSKVAANTFQGLPAKFVVNLTDDDLAIKPDDDLTEADIEEIRCDSETRISEVYEAGLKYLLNCLDIMIYVGPLREIPREACWDQQVDQATAWDKGLAAWQSLSNSQTDNTFIRTNEWLKRLQMDVSLERCQGVIRVRPAELDESVEGIRIQDVGTGISQVVPLITALCGPEDKVVLFEQPELHLHPRVQTELGDLLIETCVSEVVGKRSQSVIETHSEHLILRVLRRIRETTENVLTSPALQVFPHQVAVYHFQSIGTSVQAKRLRIDEAGEFIDRWPNGFFEERAEELF